MLLITLFSPHIWGKIIFFSTGEDRAEGASFWHAFLTPFWGPKKIFFFKKNDAEAYVWPKSDTRQAQQKLRSNLALHN